MVIEIRRAERVKSKLRVGVSGPSGSGKTYSALLIGKGLVGSWEKVCLIDTENGSGELYSHLGPYSVITLRPPFTPESYIEAIQEAEKGGFKAIIIDSASHEWDGKGGCLEINERLAGSKFKGNTWAAWSETTPRHQKFIEAITQSGAHVITTARSKTDTVQTEDKKVKKIGLKEIQREGFEYELTVNFTLDRDKHFAVASKDRTGIFSEVDPFVISEETGKDLLKWSEAGKPDIKALKREVVAQLARLDVALPADKSDAAEYVVFAVRRLVDMDAKDETKLEDIVKALTAIESKDWAAKQLVDKKEEPAAPAAEPKVEAPLQEGPKTEEKNGQ